MKTFNKTFIAAAITATTLMSGGANALEINADGMGGGVANVATIDFAVGNAIQTCLRCVDATGAPTDSVIDNAVGSIVQDYGHMTTSTLLGFGGGNVAEAGFGSTFEWTVKFGYAAIVDLSLPSGGGSNRVLDAATTVGLGGVNFFEIYYDATPDANNLSGDGFDNGLLILSGTINGASLDGTTGVDSFLGLGGGPGTPLDGNGNNDYPAISTFTGLGGARLIVDVSFQDFAFFLQDLDDLEVVADSSLNLSFQQVDPSSCFYGTAGINAGTTVLGAGNGYGSCAGAAAVTGSVGAVNGSTGPNFILQTDASAALPNIVPEPMTVALMGLGLAAMGASRRSEKA